MKQIANLLVLLVAGMALAACQKTVESRLPSGADAYTAISVAPEVARPATYVLRPGDRLNLDVFREEAFSAEKLLIDSTGNVTLPVLGTIHAEGKTSDALAADIRARLASSYLRDPRVSVMVETPALATVSVEGEVEQPGVYEIAPGYTLLTALALARSPTDNAKMDEVLIMRTVDGRRMGGRFDAAEIRAGASPDPQILPGDVVVVGYSRTRGVFQDFLKTVPLLNVFAYY
ncbi:polysaccharide export protein [Croceicoccus ponticola]|uniref:Polysaccharide export protein n=1 Tax=Croceicoccus ponticola TaxID=2217664 RepID=A0A437GY34_9SPHN|nr:polysaccharide biosynthesis/export family protein [Croceicoccus ponticola]RVQ67597.1 polysaccharide export protein [Croceicoccus ponticola]